MKTKTQIAVWITLAITFAVAMSQPTIIHQIAVFASGIFAMLGIGLVFLVRNWPETATKPEESTDADTVKTDSVVISEREKHCVRQMRLAGWSDKGIADSTGFHIENIKAIK